MPRTEHDAVSGLNADLAGRYVTRRLIAEGGMATVYLADDVRHGRTVAIKVLDAEVSGAVGAERFQREIQVAAQLVHPHILPVLDSGLAGETLYYVMPYVEGETLRHCITRVSQLSIAEACRIAAEVADGLAYAHSRGLVHRDIKPENILLSSGHAVLADFGIALVMDASADARLTRAGHMMGTAAYMSPEQWSGATRIDGRSDQYALACVLYEMLVGEPPFTGPSMQAIMARHVHAPVPSVRIVRPGVPEALELALQRGMSKAPEERFASVHDFIAAATAGAGAAHRLTGQQQAGRAVGQWRSPLVRALAAGLLVVAVALAVLLFIWIEPTNAAPTRVAVLPFQNLGEPADVHFADGITQDLTTKLSGVGGLRVIAASSAQLYRNSDKTDQQIAQELNVDYLVRGTVRWAGQAAASDSVRVSASLVRAKDSAQEWADAYAEQLTGIFAVQVQIAERITEELNVALLEPERDRLSRQAVSNVDALDHYNRANSFYDRSRLREDVDSAIFYYERAIQLDPRSAVAYARLSRAQSWMHQLRYDPSENRLEAAKAAADRAVQLDPELAEAHIAQGLYYYWGREDFERALREFTVARQLAPSNAEVLLQIGNVRRRQGRFADAIESYQLSAELDPRVYRPRYNLVETLLIQREFARAEPYLAQVAALAPELHEVYVQQALHAIGGSGDLRRARSILEEAERRTTPSGWSAMFVQLARITYGASELERLQQHLRPGGFQMDTASYHFHKALILEQQGRTGEAAVQYDSAYARLEHFARSNPQAPWVHAVLGRIYAARGEAEEAVQSAERAARLLPVSKDMLDGSEFLINLGYVHARLGDVEKAISYFDQALGFPCWTSPNWLRHDPLLAGLRSHRSFREVLTRRSQATPLALDSRGSTEAVSQPDTP